MKVCFIGIEAEIDGYERMDRFGQVVTLPDGMEAEAAAACCLPAEQFAELFAGVDVDVYAMPASHDTADETFLLRKRAANVALAEFREQTRHGGGK
jgi:hypothetical protein